VRGTPGRPRGGETLSQTFRSLRTRNYRLFAAGQLISVTGLGMQQVGQAWLVVDLTGSGVALGLTAALQFLPLLVFGMWGGLLADRMDKRLLLLSTQIAAGVLALLLAAVVVAGAVELWMVFVLAFLTGAVHAVDMPARHAFVIEMVGPEDVANAVGLNSAIFNTGRLLGPAVAGVLIASVGVALCFVANGVTYLAVVAALRAMRTDELVVQPRAARAAGQVRAALRYVWTTPELRSTLLLVAVVGTLGFNFVVILPLFATQDLGGGAPMFGLLTSLMALGSLLGALGAAHRSRPTRRLLVAAAGAFGLVTVAAAAAPGPVAAGALLVGAGWSVMVFLATANATLQLASNPLMRGRVMSLYGLVFLGSTPVGGPLMGWISEQWGARAALAVAGTACLAAAAAAAVASVRLRLRPHPAPPAATAGDGMVLAPGPAETL
jgi:MFS family permease